MSCQTLGKACDTLNDCIGDPDALCDSAICVSNRCTSTVCTNDSSCPAGMKCSNGNCTEFKCSKDSDCASKYMQCSGGLCTSITCTGRCPFGSKCNTLADGRKVCVATDELSHKWFIFAIIMCIIVAVMIIGSLVIIKKTKK